MNAIAAIIGTGTNIGKTTFVSLWLQTLKNQGHQVAAWKPIETGGTHDSETQKKHAFYSIAPMYQFLEPVSPHLAAEWNQTSIDCSRLVAKAKEISSQYPLILETAGGLFSPICSQPYRTNAEFIEELNPSLLILVAPNRLGVLHDVECVQRASAHFNKSIDAIVLIEWNEPNDRSIQFNKQELTRFRATPVYAINPTHFETRELDLLTERFIEK